MNFDSYESTLKIEQHEEAEVLLLEKKPSSKKAFATLIIVIILLLSCIAAITITSHDNKLVQSQILLQHQPPERSSLSISAPIGLSYDKSVLSRVREKYGFSETGIFVDRDVNTESTDVGWAWAYLYEGDTCAGDSVAVGGIATGTCVPIDADTNDPQSWFVDCDSDGNVYMTFYNGTDCNVLLYSEVVATTGCQVTNCTDFPLSNSSLYVSCSTGTALPLHSTYNVYLNYLNYPNATCDSGPLCFEALPLDTCLPFEHTIHSETSHHTTTYDSVVFGVSDDSPYMTYYTGSSNCTGVAVEDSLSTNCTYETIHVEEASRWEYYSPHKSSSPTVTPTRGKRGDSETYP